MDQVIDNYIVCGYNPKTDTLFHTTVQEEFLAHMIQGDTLLENKTIYFLATLSQDI